MMPSAFLRVCAYVLDVAALILEDVAHKLYRSGL